MSNGMDGLTVHPACHTRGRLQVSPQPLVRAPAARVPGILRVRMLRALGGRRHLEFQWQEPAVIRSNVAHRLYNTHGCFSFGAQHIVYVDLL